MSSFLGINATLELINQLRKIVREFAAREQALNQAAHAKLAAAARAHAIGLQARSAASKEHLAELQAKAAEAGTAAEARHAQRGVRLQQAFRSSSKRRLEQINDNEGRQKYTLQKRALEAERRRESELERTSNEFHDFELRLADSRETFERLEISARKAFSGIGQFTRLLSSEKEWPPEESGGDEHQLLDRLVASSQQTEQALGRFKRNPLLLPFRLIRVWLLVGALLLGYAAVGFVLPRYGIQWLAPQQAAVAFAGLLVLVVLGFWAARRMTRSLAVGIAGELARARLRHDQAAQLAEARRRSEQERLQAEWEETNRRLDEQWQHALQEAAHERALLPTQMEEKKAHATQRSASLHQRSLERLESESQRLIHELQERSKTTETALAAEQDRKVTGFKGELEAGLQQLKDEWHQQIDPLWKQVAAAQKAAADLLPPWADPSWSEWRPPVAFPHAARLGHLDVNIEKLAEVPLSPQTLPFPGPLQFAVPLLLTFPEQGSVLLETGNKGSQAAIDAINSLVFQLLALAPPGRVSLTIIDPAGLGQSFAGLMHLADFEESQLDSRIWTQPSQIEEKLAELNEHMEKVIQMYLRNEYATIAEYNARAGSVAEKYHFVVIAGFPLNFSETAGRRLINIATSGARCGVYTFIQWDQRHELPHDFVADELRKRNVRLVAGDTGFALPGWPMAGVRLRLETPPTPEFATEFLHKVGQSTKNANRVQLPFDRVAPAEEDFWTLDTAEEFQVPIGQSGATKLQYLTIGKGTRQHALIAGKTGSGKSTLFHVIITSLALWFSPEQVELYLVDFKKGVEFKCYANRRLPHARVVAIESDREFGLSVLQRLDEELRRRGELFRKTDVQDLAGYRKAEPAKTLPRVLLMIDEFQEFFTEEDRIAQTAAVLLDRIVRQGRAFGIHVLLGSQTLGGAYTLARATIGQMVIRIALQCNEADAYLIMDENNAAPRLLSRPGEGIYNDMAGAVEGNSPFQTAWLPEETRDAYLDQVRQRADRNGGQALGPLVFEGNEPADVTANDLLSSALQNPPTTLPGQPRVWLGAPNSIKGPTEVVFRQQSGSNLLVVGQSEEADLGIPCMTLLSLAAQFPPRALRLVLLDSTAPGSRERAFLDKVVQILPHSVERPGRHELGDVLQQLSRDVLGRTGDESPDSAPMTFVIVSGLQQFKSLRQEDEFSFSSDTGEAAKPSASLMTLITEGPSRGCHLVVTVDTYSNLARFLGRKGLAEFHSRVLFQMSASDSASLVDSPEATNLGLHRALLYNEREGHIEKFRPYTLPGDDWLAEVTRWLQSRAAT